MLRRLPCFSNPLAGVTYIGLFNSQAMSDIQYEKFELGNGLRVIVHEDHSLAKVAFNVLYRVGARNEDPDRTGFAHLFEHLMFGGSKHIPDYDTHLQRVGGENNAFTTNDITNYYISLPSNQVETAFWLESDRMLELDFSQKSLDVQKSVVIEEFKQRYLNKPYGDAHLLLRAIHFQVHPYHWPTIGKNIEQIEGASLDDVKSFFYRFYAPNNATLVLAGDITVAEAKRLSEKWFGPIPRRTLGHKPLAVEPPQTSPRSHTVHKEVPYPAVYKMYHIPGRDHPDYFAADILTDILSNGKAGHLFQRMVKESELATSARAFSWGAYDPGMISVDATLAKGKTVEEYELALQEVLKGLEDLSEQELQRVKNAVESQYVMERGVLLNKAMMLAMADSRDQVHTINDDIEIFMALTTDNIRKAAQTYFSPENCSTLYYLPMEDKAHA